MSLPNIEHATVTVNAAGGIEIRMLAGWVFYDRDNYADFTDEEGNPREPLPEEICYFRFICFPPSITAEQIESRIVVVAESEVPADQIFSTGNNHETA